MYNRSTMPDDPQEKSEAGNPIYRHQPRSKPFTPAIGDGENIRAIVDHIQRFVGETAFVFHELVSDLVHIDVHLVRPTPERNFFTLITSGMSDRPMKVPAGQEEKRYAELMICLPPTWQLGDQAGQVTGQGVLSDERNYWPIRRLKMLARLPHEYDTWLGPGHTIPTGDPPTPFAENTKFCCMMCMPSATVDKAFWKLELPDRIIHFMALWPLYEEEMNFKLSKGLGATIDRLEQVGFETVEIVDVNRKNACAKRFGLF